MSNQGNFKVLCDAALLLSQMVAYDGGPMKTAVFIPEKELAKLQSFVRMTFTQMGCPSTGRSGGHAMEIYGVRVTTDEAEYWRGKQHGHDDLAMSQRHCRALQEELDEAKRAIALFKIAAARKDKDNG